MKRIYFIVMLVLTVGGAIAQKQPTLENKVEMAKQAFAKSTADSSHIAVNRRGGWQSLVSHLTPIKNGSVLFELVVGWSHTKTDLTHEQLVGRIKLRELLPSKTQTVSFKFILSEYTLRIEPNGKCFIQLVKGAPPKSDQQVIPIRAVYKLM